MTMFELQNQLQNQLNFDKNDLLGQKVGPELANLFEQFQIEGLDSLSLPEENPLLQVNENRVQIEAIATEEADTLVEDLKELGLQDSASFGKVVNGSLPIEAIEEMAQLSSLNFAGPAELPQTNIGSVTSQGDVSMNADDARSTFNVDGSGIRIGVLSDSYNTLGGESAGVASGDLPSDVQVLDEFDQ